MKSRLTAGNAANGNFVNPTMPIDDGAASNARLDSCARRPIRRALAQYRRLGVIWNLHAG
jgi:hypothetical protein